VLQSVKADKPVCMSLPEAAKKLGMHRLTLSRQIKANVIRAVRIGSRSYVPFTEIDRLMNPCTDKTELRSGQANEMCENGAERLKMRQTDSEKTQTLGQIMATPINFEGRWKLLHASKLPRDSNFFQAMMDILIQTCVQLACNVDR
jgi:excisionase family DNA binding protein